MTVAVSSTLNPSANVFVPGKTPNLTDAMNCEYKMRDISASFSTFSEAMHEKSKIKMKEFARQLLQDYLVEKRNAEKTAYTKQEIQKAVKRVILRSNCKPDPEIKTFEDHFSMFLGVRKMKDVKTDNEAIADCTAKPFTFDLSIFKPPKPSPFLSSLYGLYRPEQAVRPLFSLTLPPSNLEDNLWSVTLKDLHLWNPYYDESCKCPPMFGYCVPLNFFGNPFNLDSKCSNEKIHFCRYPSLPNGIESTVFNTRENYPIEVDLFKDCIEVEVKGEYNLEFYSEQLKTIVSGVCDLLSNETTKESLISLIDCYEIGEYYKDAFGEADPSKFMRFEEILEDDNCHPLLEMDYMEENAGVTPEIKEMIQRCLSPDYKISSNESSTNEEIKTGCCDPPCSNWCHSRPKCERSDSLSSNASVNISLLNDTTDFLLNASKGNISSEMESNFHKRTFKRSFSANDCDLSFEERYRRIPHFSTFSKADLEFLRKDPNFLKSWKNIDGGLVSSSQKEIDIYSDEKDSFHQDHTPMWSVFSGKDSLWKPLPECAQQDLHSKFMPKRVRDLKRQRSLN